MATGDVRNRRSCDITRTMRALDGTRFTRGRSITVPVTVAVGSQDSLIRRHDLNRAQLPVQTRVLTLRGVGQVPTWDDPDAVPTIDQTADPRVP